MLRDVNITITDGGLSPNTSGTGAQFKIGVSAMASQEPIVVKSSMSSKRIAELLGLSPLADACMDSFENGAGTLHCIPVAATVQGAVSEVTGPIGAVATLVVSGKPNNAFQVSVRVVLPGQTNASTVKYSLNGGVTYSEETTIPIGGQMTLGTTGLTLTFTPGEAGFIAGDVYSFSTTAPSMSNETALAAMDRLKNVRQDIELIHVVGESSGALWSAATIKLNELFEMKRKPTFAVFEAPIQTADQPLTDYVKALQAARRSCNSTRIQVVSARGVYSRNDGFSREVNLAGVICGLYGRAKVQQSIGEVRSFVIAETKLLALTPAGIEEYISELDDLQYLTMRTYDGLPGYYVTNSRIFAPEGSDYRYAERVRVANKAVRLVRQAMLVLLQSVVDVANLDSELAAIAKFAEEPLERMVEAGEISSGRVIIPEGQDILITETVRLKIRFVPVGYARAIDIDMGMENPLIG